MKPVRLIRGLSKSLLTLLLVFASCALARTLHLTREGEEHSQALARLRAQIFRHLEASRK